MKIVCVTLMLCVVVTAQKYDRFSLVEMLHHTIRTPEFRDLPVKDQVILIELLAEGEEGQAEEYISRVGMDAIVTAIHHLPVYQSQFLDNYLREHHGHHFVDTSSTTTTVSTTVSTSTVTFGPNLVGHEIASKRERVVLGDNGSKEGGQRRKKATDGEGKTVEGKESSGFACFCDPERYVGGNPRAPGMGSQAGQVKG